MEVINTLNPLSLVFDGISLIGFIVFNRGLIVYARQIVTLAASNLNGKIISVQWVRNFGTGLIAFACLAVLPFVSWIAAGSHSEEPSDVSNATISRNSRH
jgi:hypothetical protein